MSAGEKPTHGLRNRFRRLLVRVRRTMPPGTRLPAGVLLMAGGVLGFLPVLGFWMLPLGGALATLDLVAFYRWVRPSRRNGAPRR